MKSEPDIPSIIYGDLSHNKRYHNTLNNLNIQHYIILNVNYLVVKSSRRSVNGEFFGNTRRSIGMMLFFKYIQQIGLDNSFQNVAFWCQDNWSAF